MRLDPAERADRLGACPHRARSGNDRPIDHDPRDVQRHGGLDGAAEALDAAERGDAPPRPPDGGPARGREAGASRMAMG